MSDLVGNPKTGFLTTRLKLPMVSFVTFGAIANGCRLVTKSKRSFAWCTLAFDVVTVNRVDTIKMHLNEPAIHVRHFRQI